MTTESTLRTVSPEELPGLLARLDVAQTTHLALIGPDVTLGTAFNSLPAYRWGNVAFRLTGRLAGLPHNILRLEQLQVLALRGLGLNDKDATAIGNNLDQLTWLDLRHNRVGSDGAKVIAEALGQLTSLNLGNNQVGGAGVQAIADALDQLISLSLGGNRVGDASARAIAKSLGRLVSLDLDANNISDVGAREIAARLGQLTRLNLRSTLVGNEAVAAIGRHLRNIERLDLGRNKQVTTVAPLAPLPLSVLNLAGTGVTDLSPLRSLILSELPVVLRDQFDWTTRGIYVEDCPLFHPPVEVVQQGPEAVLNYFHEIEAQGTDRLFEAKLLIVGEGGAGKTSLLRRLFQPDLDLPAEDETTRGIYIHRHDFPTSDGRAFRLNAWDFGGQQIYHATHQFFLTRRSLYVLVDDTRTDGWSLHDEGFKFWLEVVETLSEASPLLIFQNEKDGRSKAIDEAGIKGRFPNVQTVHQGDLKLPGAADALRRAIEYFAQRLPHIGEDVPAKWVRIRQNLEDLARSRPCIALEEYFDVYTRHLPFDREKALHLSQYLHDLGVFLHFREPPELRRTVFLQNQWVTDAVFRVLDDEQVKAARGRFTLADCDRLWSDPSGAEQGRADQGWAHKDVELRALMARFELCYRLPDTVPETWLVPQHLSPSKPSALADWAKTSDLMLSYRYAFLPRGLVSRLIVRMHRFVRQPDLCWSRGALFEHDGTAVLVETTTRGNEIALRARGPEHKALLSVIASDLDALNGSFAGLKDKVHKWVPCTCATCMTLTEPALFAQEELIERKARGKRTIECPKPPDYTDVDVVALLDGLTPDRVPDWARTPAKADAPFAVALSFPGEHRDFVLQVAQRLAATLGRERVFYDEWFETRLLGTGGDLKLQAFYRHAELVVPFFSEHYAKPWCALEWDTIRGVLLTRRNDDAVIPVHLDDTEIPGWPEVSFGIKHKDRNAEQIADLILDVYRQRHPDQ